MSSWHQPGLQDLDSWSQPCPWIRSLGSAVRVVDLAASPKIDRDHPPDLKHLADSAAVVEAVKALTAGAVVPTSSAASEPAAKKRFKAAAAATQGKQPAAARSQPAALNVDRLVSSIVDQVLLAKTAHV